MKIKKINLANVQGRLSRNEMKQIMGGTRSAGDGCSGTPCGGGGSGTCRTVMDDEAFGCKCSVDTGGACPGA